MQTQENIKLTYLAHHGIKGQRWGIRRYQNDDGSLTSQGRKRYNVNEDGSARLKEGFVKKEKRTGIAKVAIGGALITKGITNISNIVRNKDESGGLTTKTGRKKLNKAIFTTTLGAIVVSASSKNFINANKNKTINTVGQGPTPETFTGKAKTRNQVLAAKKKK